MIGAQSNTSPCPHCKGTGSVVTVTKDKDGKRTGEVRVTCPVCKGTRTSGGLMTK
jgi:DnaJ-class molecular chaperone